LHGINIKHTVANITTTRTVLPRYLTTKLYTNNDKRQQTQTLNKSTKVQQTWPTYATANITGSSVQLRPKIKQDYGHQSPPYYTFMQALLITGPSQSVSDLVCSIGPKNNLLLPETWPKK